MSLIVDGLRADVLSVGELGDDTVAAVADRIGELLSRSMPARVLDLLSDVSAEVSSELPEGHLEIRVAGDDIHLAYVEDATARAEFGNGMGEGAERDRDLSARITLRLSESLKARVEDGATREGVSVNAYIVRALERGAANDQKRQSHAGNRLRGYGTT
jgi:hypothetical protein